MDQIFRFKQSGFKNTMRKALCVLMVVSFLLPSAGLLPSAQAQQTQTISNIINFGFETPGAAATIASNWTAFTAGGTTAFANDPD